MNAIDTTIPDFLRRSPLTWTYTMLQTYADICPHQAERRYVRKKGDPLHIPYSETKEMKWGNDVHTAMELRILGGKPLPESMHAFEKYARPFDGKQVYCEPKLAINRQGKPTGYFDKDVWGRCRCDVARVEGDKCYLLDFKTGKMRENPFELEVQAVFMRIKHPQLRTIKGQFAWLKDDTLGPLHDLSDVRKTWGRIMSIVEQIEADRVRGEFDKKPGGLCGWCDVKDCQYNKKVA